MTTSWSKRALKAAHQTIDHISIHPRHGVWRVVLNGDFYGDYVRRNWATDAALRKAEEVAGSGGAAIVTWAEGGQRDVIIHDTRRTAADAAAGSAEPPSSAPFPSTIGEGAATPSPAGS